MKAAAWTLGAILVLVPTLAMAAPASQTQTSQIRVEYLPPKNPAHRELFELLKKYRALENVQQLLSPFRLPRPLTIKLEGCDGDINAWYADDAVTVCYEYLDDVWRNAPNKTTSAGVTPIDAVLGPLYDVFFHEMGHALFDLLKVPVFGREEDAADQVSTYIMLHFGRAEARRLILGTAYAYRGEFGPSIAPFAVVALSLLLMVVGGLVRRVRWWMIGSGGTLAILVATYLAATNVYFVRKQFSDEHGTPAQRFYNLLCIAYGADAKLFADIARNLPKDRAEGCEEEYRQVAFAFQTLIEPHMDQDAAKSVMQRAWLPGAGAGLPRRHGPARSLRSK